MSLITSLLNGTGDVTTNAANTFTKAPQEIDIDAAGNVGLIVKEASGQTADVFQWKDNSGTILGRIISNGGIDVNTAAGTQAFVMRGNFSGGQPGLGNTLAGTQMILSNEANAALSIRTNAIERINIAGTGVTNFKANVGIQIANKTTTYTITDTDSVITADATTAAFTVTLPTAVGRTGQCFTIKRTNAGANNVTVGTTSAQTIDGATTQVLTAQNWSITVASDGSNWQTIGEVSTAIL